MNVKATMEAKSSGAAGKIDELAEPDFDMRMPNPLEDLRKQAEMAYTTYLDAQRKVANAYRERERAEVVLYKETEREANRACDQAIEAAASVRSAAQRRAREEYEKALETAESTYQQRVAEALYACRESIDRQWQAANELSEQTWNIFQGHNGA